MKKILSTILTLLLITTLTISTADAGGGIKISRADFSLGSLIVDGVLKGTGPATVTVYMEASGTCNNEPVFATSNLQVLSGSKEAGTKNNNSKKPFHLVAPTFGNCSNDPELTTPEDFVFWDSATIFVYAGDATPSCDYPTYCGPDLQSSALETDNPLLISQLYACDTNQDAYTVSCVPVKNPGSNNSGFPICHATGNQKNPYVLLSVNGHALNGHGKHAGDIIPAPADGCPN